MINNQGKFIVIDGTDGSGKTTQLNLLQEKLKEEGYEVKIADFPQYNTKSAGLVEEYLSGKYGEADEVGPYKASIFYAADRFDASKKIYNWLKEGKIILANRYTSASLGHQGGKINNPLERKIFFNWLYDLEYKIFEIPRPDLTIVLQVEPKISYQLAKERKREDWKGKTKDIHENNLEHLKKAEQTYIEIASSLPNFKLIKCTHNNKMLSPEAIHFLVWLVASQVIKKIKPENKDFQAIGNIIGKNENIINNRELILNKQKRKSSNTSVALAADKKEKVFSVSENITINSNQEKDKDKQELLLVEKINKEAKILKKAHQNDAGYDLFANSYYSIPAYSQALVSTGIKIALPKNYAGLIWDKSGLANNGITTMGGVIDTDYRGEIKVIVKNLSEDIFNIVPGQKIAQIIIQKIENLKVQEEKIENNTARQDQGFGSTGKF